MRRYKQVKEFTMGTDRKGHKNKSDSYSDTNQYFVKMENEVADCSLIKFDESYGLEKSLINFN